MRKGMNLKNRLKTQAGIKVRLLRIFAGTLGIFTILALMFWLYTQIGNSERTFAAAGTTPPANDLKSNAHWLTDLYEDQSAFAAFTNAYATADVQSGSCFSGSSSHGVWFKFQALYSGASITVKTGGAEGSIRNVEVALFDNNDNEISCSSASGTGDAGITTGVLTQNDWYYILVNSATADTGSFTLYINNVSPVKYYVRSAGNWNSASTWSTSGYNGPAASGIPSRENVVFIKRVDKNLKIDGYTGECAGIVFTGGNKDSKLEVKNNGTLNVYGKYFMESADNKKMDLKVDNSTFYVQDSMVVRQNGGSKRIRITFKTATVNINRSAGFDIISGKRLRVTMESSSVVSISEDLAVMRSGGNEKLDFKVDASTLNVNGDAFIEMNGGTGSNAKTKVTFKQISNITVQGDFTVKENTGAQPIQVLIGKNGSTADRATLQVNGDFRFGASSGSSADQRVDISVYTDCVVEVKGDIIHTTTKGQFDFVNASAILKLTGTDKQYICGEKTGTAFINYQNILVNNTFSSTPDSVPAIYLQGPVSLEQQLDLNDGIVKTSPANLITLQSGALLAGGSDTSFVDGPFKKEGGSTFTFPIGNEGVYAPLDISNFSNTASSNAFTARYFNNSYTDTTTDATLAHVSSIEYWDLQRSNGTANVQVSIHWRDGARSGISNLPDLAIAGYTGSFWTSLAPFSISGSVSQGSITTNNRQNSFGFYTFGSQAGGNILPIKLAWFDVQAAGQNVIVKWASEMERNNDFYTVERSRDGMQFEIVGTVKGAGNSERRIEYEFTDENPYPGISYYRLKQTDLDGQYEYFEIKEVFIEKPAIEQSLQIEKIYPNPAQDYITLDLASPSEEEIVLGVYDLSGRLILQETARLNSGQNNLTLQLPAEMAAGNYILSVQTPNERSSIKFIKSR